MSGFLDNEYKIRPRTPTIPADDELNYVFGVVNGTKPAALVALRQYPEVSKNELESLLASRGCKIFTQMLPLPLSAGGRPTLRLDSQYFIYRDEAVKQRYIEVMHKRYADNITNETFHQVMGEIFGYKQSDIDDFISKTPYPQKRPNVPLPHEALDYYRQYATKEDYEKLAKDPVLGGILPPRDEPTRKR